MITSGRNSTPWSIWVSLDPSAPRGLNEQGEWPKTPDRDTFIKILEAASTEPGLSERVKVYSAEDILREKLDTENALRRRLGLEALTEVEIAEAFSQPYVEPGIEPDSSPSP